MARLPKNMVRRSGRAGYWYRRLENGRDRITCLGTDYDEAVEKLQKYRQHETPIAEITVGAAAERWLREYVDDRRSEKFRADTRVRTERYFLPHLGAMLVSRVKPEHLRSYSEYLKQQDISLRTVAHVLGDARCFFRWCEEAALLTRSPFPRRLMPRIQEQPPDRLSDEEAERLRALPDPHGFVCRLALETGLRWGELCRVKTTDLERGALVVHQTKSGRVRRVPLSPAMATEVRRRVGLLVGFAALSPGSFARVVARRADVLGFHVHQMRHTFACQYLERGGNLAALQQILGHADVQTTQRYGRLSDDAVKADAARVHAAARELADRHGTKDGTNSSLGA